MVIKTVNKEEVVEIVRDYVSDVFGSLSGFFLSNIVKKDELWVVEGKIFMNMLGVEGISKQLAALTEEVAREIKIAKIAEKMVAGMKGSTSFYFYVNSYGKICASCAKDINIFDIADKYFSQILPYWKEIKEKDMKDYCQKAKNFIEKGTTFRSFDFIPVYGWCKSKDEGVIFSIVILYSLTRTIVIPYVIEIVGDEVDLKMIEEPIERKI